MANEYSADVPKGFNVPKQVRLDSITGVQNEDTLKNLGTGNNLAFKYYDGLKIYCKDEKTEYIWREVVGLEEGLLDTNFTYPTYPAVDGIDYSGKVYNFFELPNSNLTLPNGSETKLTAGTNVTITGSGTSINPYNISSTFETSEIQIEGGDNIVITGVGTEINPFIVNANLEDLGIVKTINDEVIAPNQSLSIINNEITGKILTTKEYVDSIIPTSSDGSETKLDSGENINITGTGTTQDPYIISTDISNSNIYTGISPTTINVGGLVEGSSIFGKSYDQIIESIVAPYLLPIITQFNIQDQLQIMESGTNINGFKSFNIITTQSTNIQENSLSIFLNNAPLVSEYPITSPTIINVPITNFIGDNVTTSFKATIIATDNEETIVSSNLFNITSRYKQFFGNVDILPTSSTEVRNLTNNNFTNINNWTTPIINKTKYVIAIPSTKNLISVITQNNEEITSNFVLSTFNVNDAGTGSIAYKIYSFSSALPLNLTVNIILS